MVGGGPPAGATPGLGAVLEAFLHMPSPEKLLAELQRLNNNMEIVAPDLHKLVAALEGDKLADMINEVTRLGGQIYERIWGPR